MTISIRNLTYQMLREEWRFHERIVGSRAFVIFPLVFAFVSAGLLFAASQYAIDTTTTVIIAHIAIFAVGLHMGNVSLTGRDAIDDLLSGLRFLVYTSRTMPVSTERLVGVFLLKNTLYYTAMLTVPVALSFLFLLEPTTIPFLAISLTGMYVWGLVAALLGVNVMAYGPIAKILATLAFTAVTVAWLVDAPVVALTPYIIAIDPTPLTFITGLLPLLCAAVLGVILFTPTLDEQLRVANDRYKEMADMLPVSNGSIAAKTLLDVSRSSGGLLKLVVSATLLFGVCLYLFTLMETHMTETSLATAMGALLGLEAILVYTWLVRFDTFDEYAFLPMTADTLVRGKTLAFTLLAVPLAGMHYFTAILVLDVTPLDTGLGAVVLISLLVFFFGIAVLLAQFDPHERLLHPLRFLLFATAIFTPLLGFFVVSFTYSDLTPTLAATVAGAAVTCALIGGWCLRRAATHWEVSST